MESTETLFLVAEASVTAACSELERSVEEASLQRKLCLRSTAASTSFQKKNINFTFSSVLWAQSESSVQNGTSRLQGFSSAVCFPLLTVGKLPVCCLPHPTPCCLVLKWVVEQMLDCGIDILGKDCVWPLTQTHFQESEDLGVFVQRHNSLACSSLHYPYVT